jgi:hypothetical protein
MSTRVKAPAPRRTALAVEQLEDRRLLSVTVTPPVLNLKTVGHGHGVFTVRLVSDTEAGKALLQSLSSLTASVTQGGTAISLGTSPGAANGPVSVLSADVNGDGTPDLTAKYRRSALKGLAAGTATLTVSNGSTSESTTITLFSPGQQGHHGHGHHHGHHHHNGDGAAGHPRAAPPAPFTPAP